MLRQRRLVCRSASCSIGRRAVRADALAGAARVSASTWKSGVDRHDSVGSPLVWALFGVIVVAVLAIDLGIFHRKAHVVRMREAAIWTGGVDRLALLLQRLHLFRFGRHQGGRSSCRAGCSKYALSIDNIFVFLVVFSLLPVPAEQQHRVLFWGILGAVISRGVFIGARRGAASQRFHWVMYILGAFLVYTGFKILVRRTRSRSRAEPGLRCSGA